MRVRMYPYIDLFTNSTEQPKIETAENKIFDCHNRVWPPLVLPSSLETV